MESPKMMKQYNDPPTPTLSPQTVVSNGIYHGLPTFPDAKPASIIVTGANGITGQAMVKVLAANPSRWPHIHAMSRRPPPDPNAPKTVHPIAVDFLKSPQEIAAIFKKENVQADYVFFASYVQPPPKEGGGIWSDTDELDRINAALLSNFLEALTLAKITPKRIMLQTGGKYYAVHIGPTPTPQDETDPRIQVPNFYYPQEDMLWAYSAKNNSTWNVTRPGFILGAVKDAAMSILYPLAIYASIQKHLGKMLEFPGTIEAWEAEKHESTAKLIAWHAEWALLSDAAKDTVLNHSDGGVFAFGKFWPMLASWYGVEAGIPETDMSKYSWIDMPDPAPRGYASLFPSPSSLSISLLTPNSFGPKGRIGYTFTFESWASEPAVLKAWEEIRHKFNLQQSPFDDVQKNFGLLDAEILTPWSRSINMNRSRKLGWNGFVDTNEAIKEVIGEMAELGMVPAVQ
jgi:nucleoside-diphosphate-sugar epimerase